jgi:hypothetical protein
VRASTQKPPKYIARRFTDEKMLLKYWRITAGYLDMLYMVLKGHLLPPHGYDYTGTKPENRLQLVRLLCRKPDGEQRLVSALIYPASAPRRGKYTRLGYKHEVHRREHNTKSLTSYTIIPRLFNSPHCRDDSAHLKGTTGRGGSQPRKRLQDHSPQRHPRPKPREQ